MAWAGSIPACAGEPSDGPKVYAGGKVYPRVCGGTSSSLSSRMTSMGLSPRVRGNRLERVLHRGVPRSIPACAGEPRGAAHPPATVVVYPRVCGGTPGGGTSSGDRGGLSPRVRGNLRWPVIRRDRNRSIPACAGEPSRPSKPKSHWAVYPRVCGGTIREELQPDVAKGLSPRVRGNLASRTSSPGVLRSIPACAGEPRPGCRPQRAE